MANEVNIFFIYAPEDKAYYSGIRSFFGQLQPGTFLDCEPDLLSPPETQLRQRLEQAHLVVLLITNRYFNTPAFDWLHDRAFERFQSGKVAIVPILCGASLYDQYPEFGDLAPLPALGRTITSFPDRDEAFLTVTTELLQTARTLKEKTGETTSLQLVTESLFLLNYDRQIEKLQDRYLRFGNRFAPLNIFLLRGTRNCGHNLLIQDILRREEFNIHSSIFPPTVALGLIRLDAQGLWYATKNALRLQLESNLPADIAKGIIGLLNEEDIILRFSDIGECDKAEVLSAINAFWYELNGFLRQSGGHNRLFIFLNDTLCTQAFTLDEFCFQEGDPTYQEVIDLLPPIGKLSREGVQDWLKVIRKIGGPYLALAHRIQPERIVPGEPIYMKQAILNIIKELDLADQAHQITEMLKL